MSIQKGFFIDPETHQYCFIRSSVSAIVTYIYGDTYTDVDPNVLRRASQRGTCIHAQLEQDAYYCHCPMPEVSHGLKAQKMGQARDRLFEKYKPKNQWREITVLYDELIGCIDLLLEYDNNKWVFVDYKTTRDVYNDKWKCQLGLYFYLAFEAEWRQKLKDCKFVAIHNGDIIDLDIKPKDIENYIDWYESYKIFEY